MSVERYIRFKIDAPSTVTKKADLEVYRKLEYLGPVEDGKVKKLYLRKSIKQPWQRYLDSHEYISNRDDDNKDMFLDVSSVHILEDMDKLTYLKKYFVALF